MSKILEQWVKVEGVKEVKKFTDEEMELLEKMRRGKEGDKTLYEGLTKERQTLLVLKFCTKYYEYVGIRELTPHHANGQNKPYLYPYDNQFIRHSIVGQPYCLDKRLKTPSTGDYDGWPAIWGAVKYAGLEGSCGNSHQYQINNSLIQGLYKCDGKDWYKREIQ